MQSSAKSRSCMITTDAEELAQTFAEDVDNGLSAVPKSLPCIYFYDYQGSLLFEQICRLPEYYLTGAEASILRTYSEEIASYLSPDTALVELGSGSSVKTDYIIEQLIHQYGKVTYSPIDISSQMLKESTRLLLNRYEDLEILSVAAEYHEGIRQIDKRISWPKLILWLGSSIGNFEHNEAIIFLRNITELLGPEDLLLVGFDLRKDIGLIERAYNDSSGITARFNLNLLGRINRQLRGEFDLGQFYHEAVYNRKKSRIEMYLVSRCTQDVYIGGLNRNYHFAENEKIHTENSHKFSMDTIEDFARQAGMALVEQWLDDRSYFCLSLFRRKGRGR